MFGSMFLVTQYLQTVLGFSALQAGLRMLPAAAVMLTVAPLSPRIVEHVGTKSWWAAVCSSSPSAWSPRPGAGAHGYPHLLLAMVVDDHGDGPGDGPGDRVDHGILAAVEGGRRFGDVNITRQMGGALGVAIVGSIAATSYRRGSPTIWPPSTCAAAMTSAKDSVGGAVDLARLCRHPSAQWSPRRPSCSSSAV